MPGVTTRMKVVSRNSGLIGGDATRPARPAVRAAAAPVTRAGRSAPELREELVEALVGLVHAALHARAEHAVALLGGVEDARRHDARLLTEVLELGRLDGHVAGHALPLEGLHDALVRRHLAVGAAEAGLAPVGVGAHEAPASAGLRLHDVDLRGRAARAPPLRDQLGIGEDAEDALARGVEDALDPDRAV